MLIRVEISIYFWMCSQLSFSRWGEEKNKKFRSFSQSLVIEFDHFRNASLARKRVNDDPVAVFPDDGTTILYAFDFLNEEKWDWKKKKKMTKGEEETRRMTLSSV